MTTKTSNISEAEYKTLKARYEDYHAQREVVCQGRNYVTPEDAKQLPESLTHDEISAIEVYEFRHNPPARYFAYVTRDLQYITTWTGEILGKIIEAGGKYRSNMGDNRINIRVRAINGKNYSGTFYMDAGDYCRIKTTK
jgi:hypothetical protein